MKNLWKDRPVLVTGAGGFIGSHLTERLLDLGAKVRVFVRYNSRGDWGLLSQLPPEKLEKVEVVAGDLRDLPAVSAAVKETDCIFHLGALIAIPYSYIHPVEVIETNVLGTMNILLAAREAGVGRIVHTSTSEVYGTALRIPIDESHPLQGQSPYSASKISADKIAESFYRSYELPVVTLRPFNTYGPRQSARAVIPAIISQALTGDVIRLGNLDARRDLTYVSDTVDGFIKVGEASGVIGETINLGTGKDVSIGDLAETILNILGKPIEIQVDPARLRPEKSEVMQLLSNNNLAKSMLGWSPKVSLKEGLQKTIEWIARHLGDYRPDRYQV